MQSRQGDPRNPAAHGVNCGYQQIVGQGTGKPHIVQRHGHAHGLGHAQPDGQDKGIRAVWRVCLAQNQDGSFIGSIQRQPEYAHEDHGFSP